MTKLIIRIALSQFVFAFAVVVAIAGALSIIGTLFLFIQVYLLLKELVKTIAYKCGLDIEKPSTDLMAGAASAATSPLWAPFFLTMCWILGENPMKAKIHYAR